MTAEEIAAKAASDKAAQEAAGTEKAKKDAEAAALAYEPKDFKLPDGSKLDPKEVERIVTSYKGRGLKRDSVQTILEHEALQFAEDSASEAEERKQLESTQAKWDKELFDSPDFGAGNSEAHKVAVEESNRAILSVFGEKFAKFVQDTGFNRLPEFRLGMRKLGKLFAEDKLRSGNGSAHETGEKRSDAELMYNENAR
jgi:hypothetical protein